MLCHASHLSGHRPEHVPLGQVGAALVEGAGGDGVEAGAGLGAEAGVQAAGAAEGEGGAHGHVGHVVRHGAGVTAGVGDDPRHGGAVAVLVTRGEAVAHHLVTVIMVITNNVVDIVMIMLKDGNHIGKKMVLFHSLSL